MKIRTDRLFAAVLSLIITLSITLVTIVAVMAANSQTLSGSMSVSYHANNVAATLRATYQVAGSNNAVSLVNPTNNTDYLRFYATDATTTGELNGGNIYLTSSSPYVLFTFAFTNNATRDLENNVQGYDIRITLRDNSVRNNVTARYMTDTTVPSGTLSSKYETMSEASTELPSAVYVGAEQTVYFYLLLEITDLDYGAQYASYSNAGVSWTLDHVDYLEGDWVNYGWIINENNVVTGYIGHSTDLVIPSTATEINANLFENNTTITSVIIPNTITNVGSYAFRNCTNLESVIFENGGATSTTIGNQTFRSCRKLYNLTLSENITIIRNYAFYDCRALTSITIPNSVTYIGDHAFYDTRIKGSLTVSANVTYIGYGAFTGWTQLTTIIVYENNSKYYSQNNCIIRKSDKALIAGCKNSIIPNDITSIQSRAFTGVSPTTVTIPNSVTSIGSNAFYFCSELASITIPSSVTSIGEYAFKNCSKLASVYFEHLNISSITSIGAAAFKDLKSGVAYYFKDTQENVASWGKFTTDYFDNTTYHSY